MKGTNSYPFAAGFKGDKQTGVEAAMKVSRDLGRRHRQTLETFALYGAEGATCDDLAVKLDLPVHIIRPRASELDKQGRLFAVGRRKGGMGCDVTVYSVLEPAETKPSALSAL